MMIPGIPPDSIWRVFNRVIAPAVIIAVFLLTAAQLRSSEKDEPQTDQAAIEPSAPLGLPSPNLTVERKISAPAEYVTVIDGDTLIVGSERVRLFGVDAPEIEQLCATSDIRAYMCGEEARSAMQALVHGHRVNCAVVDTDRYGRAVGVCRIDGGEDLGALMVSLGFAFDWPTYSGGAYEHYQALAKENKQGLWNGVAFQFPWTFRQELRRSAEG